MSLFNATASGNIAAWSADLGSAPNIGTAVYNPTVGSPAPGQVQYNSGYTSVPVGKPENSNPGRFNLQVANGQIDMTINVVGYWLPISWNETRSGDHSIAFGTNTSATNVYSTAMGLGSTASGGFSLATGYHTTAGGGASTALGYQTSASGNASTAMGANTTAIGVNSTAIGDTADARGLASIAMGNNAEVLGNYSIAMGSNVSVVGKGSFYWGDGSSRGLVSSSGDNQFAVYASGGVVLYSGPGVGASLVPGSGSWTVVSDRNAKTAVHPVDSREILKKVTSLPLNTWQYKTQDAKYRHMGPMAQDFYAAFQLGESDKGIDTVDADGVALAAIQGLNALLTERDEKTAARFEEKDREIASLHAELSAQKNRVATLESLAGDMAELKAQLVTLRRLVPTEVTVVQQQP